MTALLVEDDLQMVAMLSQVLASAGFTIDVAADGRCGLQKALDRRYAVIVLDLMLPYLDGLRLCSEFRARGGATPILMTTARDSVNDRVRGLEVGADDYLPKPFDAREFLARVRSLVRRDRVFKSRDLQVGALRIDTGHRVAVIGETSLNLTKLEFGILELLAGHVGQIVSKTSLLELLWQDREPGSNKLEVAMRSLRVKLEAAGVGNPIETVYGFGYRIAPTGESP